MFGLGTKGIECDSTLFYKKWKFKVQKFDLTIDFTLQHSLFLERFDKSI